MPYEVYIELPNSLCNQLPVCIQGRCTESEKGLGNDVVYRLWILHDYTRSCMICLLVPALPTSLNPRDWNVGM